MSAVLLSGCHAGGDEPVLYAICSGVVCNMQQCCMQYAAVLLVRLWSLFSPALCQAGGDVAIFALHQKNKTATSHSFLCVM